MDGTRLLFPGDVGNSTNATIGASEFNPDYHPHEAAWLGYLLNQGQVGDNDTCRSMFCSRRGGSFIRTPTLDDYSFHSRLANNNGTQDQFAVDPWVGVPGAMALVGLSTKLLAVGTIDAIAGTFQVHTRGHVPCHALLLACTICEAPCLMPCWCPLQATIQLDLRWKTNVSVSSLVTKVEENMVCDFYCDVRHTYCCDRVWCVLPICCNLGRACHHVCMMLLTAATRMTDRCMRLQGPAAAHCQPGGHPPDQVIADRVAGHLPELA